MSALVNLVRIVAGLVAGVIAVGVLLVVLDANEDNKIVSKILDIDRRLTRPFRGIIDLARGKEHLQIAINWGIAAAVYLAIGFVIAALLSTLFLRRAR